MSLNTTFINAIENGHIHFNDFERSKPLEPNLKKSVAASRLFRGLLMQYGQKPRTKENWIQFLNWVVKSKMLSQQSKTWRITKSRLKNVFEHPVFVDAIENAEKELSNEIDLVNNDSPGSSSSKKAKFMPEYVSNSLIRFLKSSKSENAEHAIRWIKVSLITGMRGIEWSKADFHHNNGNPFLRIVNTTKGSPFSTSSTPLSPIRNFPLTHISLDDIELIKEHLIFVKEIMEKTGGTGFNKHYENVTNLIYLQNRKLPDEAKVGGSYGIYSCRHQVIANLKASKQFTIEQIGRMMGQSTRRVTERTYAKAKMGYQTDTPFFDDIDEA